MDALLYGLAILVLAILGTAGRWADGKLKAPSSPRSQRLARLVLAVATWAFYLAFAVGLATVLYAIGTWSPPTECIPATQVCQ